MKNNKRRYKIKNTIKDLFVHIIPISIALITIAPFFYVIIISFQHVHYLAGDPKLWFTSKFTLETYQYVFKNTGILRWMLNSIIVATCVTGIGLLIYSAAGYAFFRNRHHKLIGLLFGFVMIGIMVPKAVTIIPTFIMAKEFQLTNKYLGLILPPLAIPVGVFLVRQAMYAFPLELVDAAKIDGCSEISAFYKVVLPILAPSLVVVAIYTFMEQWRDFLWPLIVTSTTKMSTMPVGVSTLSSEFKTDWGVFMAGVMVTMLPGVIVFLIFQRYFIKGMTAGALKE